jgi:hypothetical protein
MTATALLADLRAHASDAEHEKIRGHFPTPTR